MDIDEGLQKPAEPPEEAGERAPPLHAAGWQAGAALQQPVTAEAAAASVDMQPVGHTLASVAAPPASAAEAPPAMPSAGPSLAQANATGPISAAAAAAAAAAPPAITAAAPPPAAAPAATGFEPAPSRSKKGRSGGGKRSGSEPPRGAAAAAGNELVRLAGPISDEKLERQWRPVRLSEEEKAGQIDLDDSGLGASSSKGYRMVRSTHGAYEGTWYFEVLLEDLGKTGAARVGWSTGRGELQAPVGYDVWSYGYRSLGGSKVHAGWRHEYGEAYQTGDVVGCLIHLPPGGKPWEKQLEEAVTYKKKAYWVEGEEETKEPDPETPALPGSWVAFTRNGKLQGKAFEPIKEGTYYPAISLYTDAAKEPFETARVRCNFGETAFAHPPPQLEGVPAAKPLCEVAGPRPQAANGSGQQEGPAG
ncbi:hypothetical protein N2152v2_008700 [Parachlorella kessleri]